MDKYTLGRCKKCKKDTALKNGYCPNCKEPELPDIFKDIQNQSGLFGVSPKRENND